MIAKGTVMFAIGTMKAPKGGAGGKLMSLRRQGYTLVRGIGHYSSMVNMYHQQMGDRIVADFVLQNKVEGDMSDKIPCRFCGHIHNPGASYSCVPKGIGAFRPETRREIMAMSESARNEILTMVLNHRAFVDAMQERWERE